MQKREEVRIATTCLVALAGLISGAVQAQQVTPTPTQPIVPPTTTPTTPTDTAQIGNALWQPRAAVPLPNPNLSNNAAMPDQRGYMRAEPLFIYPFAALGLGHNSNLLGRGDQRISSSVAVLSTRLLAEARSGGNRYQFAYGGSYGRYMSSHADDYNNSEFVARAINQFTTRLDLNANVYYLMTSDPRGTTTRAYSDRPDRYNAFGALGTLGYGARSGPGRVEADLGYTNKTYQNNRQVTANYDVESFNVAGRFLYRIAPATRLLIELRNTDYQYKASNSPLDSTERRALVGATWDIAAATSGTVKVGYVKKQFDSGQYASFSGLNVESSVRWMPRTYSTIELVASRAPNDSTGLGTLTNDTYVAGIWSHRWHSYLSSRVVASYLNSNFQGFDRTDKVGALTVGGYFDVRTWLRFGLEAGYTKRNSTAENLSFSRNTVMLTVGATL